MAGVMFISVGGGPLFWRPALVGRVARIRRASQPGIFVHNRSRLGRRGKRPILGHRESKIVVTIRRSCIRFIMANPILDRTDIFSIPQGKPAFRAERILSVVDRDICHRTSSKRKILFHKKRGT